MTNKTILITGAAKRIGAAMARGLHGANMDVIIHYNTSSSEAKELTSELNAIRPDSAYPLAADLLDTDKIESFINQAWSFKQRLDVLINNASVFYPTPIDEISATQWEFMFGLNLKAPLFLSTIASSHLAKNNGCIINLADVHAERPLKNYSLYSMSKAGLAMQTKALAKELGPKIRVNAISPGAILWPENIDDKTKQTILDRTILKKQGEVADIVNASYFLIENADYMTGQILTIDGGRTIFS
jgi:pteridine reductase